MRGLKAPWMVGVVLVGLDFVACSNGSGGAAGGGGPAPETVPIRRLTVSEYTASVTDLFPDVALPPLSFALEQPVLGFYNLSSAQTGNRNLLEQFETAAGAIGTKAAENPTALTGCDVTAQSEVNCAQPYLYDLAKRAYRRPITTDEQTALWALFSNPDGGDYQTRLALAISGVLLSPKFLFRPELGDAGRKISDGVLALTPWETATRLSYFINGSLPDQQLRDAAESGKLATVAEVRKQAARLLALPRSQETLAKFHEGWLGVDRVSALTKDAGNYPNFSGSLALQMAQETRKFLQSVMFTQQGKMEDLFLSTYTFGSKDLAAFYGAAQPATDWDRIELDPTQRMGLLTQASLLATLASELGMGGGTPIKTPVYRGKFVLERLLCRNVMQPSTAITAMFQPQDFTKTTREASQIHRVNAVCASCHDDMDPLGLPFEHYDGIGQWRDTDRGMPIDTTGQVQFFDEDNNPTDTVPFDGVPALSQIVATRPETRRCYVEQWFRFANGKLDGEADKPYLQWLSEDLTRDKKLVDFVVDLVASDSFRQIKVAQ